MALWMNRAGSRGEWEQHFLQDHRIYLRWEELDQNLSLIADNFANLSTQPTSARWRETTHYSLGAPLPIEAKYSAARLATCSCVRSSLWVAMPHSCPNGSVTLP